MMSVKTKNDFSLKYFFFFSTIKNKNVIRYVSYVRTYSYICTCAFFLVCVFFDTRYSLVLTLSTKM